MKIPVGKTLEAAFTFGLKNFLSVLGTVWFPFLISIVLVGGVFVLSFATWHGDFPDPKVDPNGFLQLILHFSGAFGLSLIVFIVMGAMIQVGLLRKALGLHPAPVFIYFSLGEDVWRMIGAIFLLILIMMGFGFAALAAGLAIFGIAHVAMGDPGSYWITGLSAVALYCAYIYIAVRISYFLPAVVVAEHNIGIGRAWALGGGNFWRIIAVVIVISLGVNIAASLVQSAFAPPFILSFNQQQPDPSEFFHMYMHYLSSAGPALAIVGVLQTILLYGLLAGALAYAYRAVTSPPESLPKEVMPA